jgi:hypothetical protein
MTSDGKDTRTLSRLARDVIEGRYWVNPNELLVKADEFLNALPSEPGDTDFINAVRAVAHACCDWSVFQAEDDWMRLRNSLRTAEMIFDLETTLKTLDG